jgi:hypothetical protein
LNRAVNSARRAPIQALSVWRWYAPAELVSATTGSNLPVALLPKIRGLIEFNSVGDLMAALDSTQRHKIPKSLQRKLGLLFQTGTYLDTGDQKFAFRKMGVGFGGHTYEIAYPLKAIAKVEISQLEIAEFHIKQRKKFLEISTRIAVSSNAFLGFRRVRDAEFFRVLLSTAWDDDEFPVGDIEILTKWLIGNGFPSAKARIAAADTDFRIDLRYLVQERIEEFIFVSGTSSLENQGDEFVLEADEEMGFTAS